MTIDDSSDAPGVQDDAAAGPPDAASDRARPAARKQMLLRLDPVVHEAIAKWAADDLRSVNAQIEVVLRRALRDAGRDPRPAPLRGRGRPRRDESST